MEIRTRLANLIAPGIGRRMETLERTAKAAFDTVNLRTQESFASLQALAMEDREFVAINAQYDRMFSREFLTMLWRQSRFFFLKNPVIRRGTLLQSYYCFGRGVEIRIEGGTENKADAQNAVLQKFLKANVKTLGITGLSECENSLQTDGNIFFMLFPDKLRGPVRVRTVDALEIVEILTDPDDTDSPWFYKRTWTEQRVNAQAGVSVQTFQAWYPSLEYATADGVEHIPTMLGYPIHWESPIYHRKVNAPAKALFGMPEAWAAFDWVTAYKQFIASWLTKEQALSRLAVEISTPGGQKVMDQIQDRLATTLSTGQSETNPPVQGGSFFVHGPSAKVNTIKTNGANTSPDEARRAFLMGIMLFGPETFFGDASVGSLATAESLDRPTELKFLFAQERWKEDLRAICSFAIRNQAEAPAGELRSPKKDATEPAEVLVSFPPILEHSITDQVTAIVLAATLDGKALAGMIDPRSVSAQLLHVLGFQKVDEVLDAMYPTDGYDATAWAATSPEEKAAQAADIANRATLASQSTNNATESAAAAALAVTVRRLIEVLPKKR